MSISLHNICMPNCVGCIVMNVKPQLTFHLIRLNYWNFQDDWGLDKTVHLVSSHFKWLLLWLRSNEIPLTDTKISKTRKTQKRHKAGFHNLSVIQVCWHFESLKGVCLGIRFAANSDAKIIGMCTILQSDNYWRFMSAPEASETN